MPSSEDEVRTASTRFYAALNRMANGDDSAMGAVWSQGPSVTSQHPGKGRQVGWSQIQDSFHQFSLAVTAGQIRLEDQMIQVAGDFAYELGVERGSCKLGGHPVLIDSRVTNIYRQESGEWKMVHHHSDVSATMVEVMEQLMAKASASH